jgi:hypothetical protein
MLPASRVTLQANILAASTLIAQTQQAQFQAAKATAQHPLVLALAQLLIIHPPQPALATLIRPQTHTTQTC